MNYPLTNFHFTVNWGGTRIGFSEISGLNIEYDVIEFREESSPEYQTIKIPGQQKFSNIILKRGIQAGANDFFNWINSIALKSNVRRDLIVSLLNEKHEPVVTWRVKNAWPMKYIGPELNAKGHAVAIETLELAHEGITIENGN